MAKALDEIHEMLDGREGMGRHRAARLTGGRYVAADEDDMETDRERAAARRLCHGLWKPRGGCNECEAAELAKRLRRLHKEQGDD